MPMIPYDRSLDPCVTVWRRITQESQLNRISHMGFYTREKINTSLVQALIILVVMFAWSTLISTKLVLRKIQISA
jgi:hypothetical protein